MRKAIFLRFLIILSIGLFLFGGIVAVTVSNLFSQQTEQQLKSSLTLLAELFDPKEEIVSQADRFSQMLEQKRITILTLSGDILADSKVPQEKWSNQGQYAEIKAANEQGFGIASHYSVSEKQNMTYAALRTADGHILRIAQPYNLFVQMLLTQGPALLIAFLIAISCSLLLAGKFTSHITQPLEELANTLSENQDLTLIGQSRYPEVARIIYRINLLARSMKLTNRELNKEREKIEFILDNLEEGLVLLDDKQNILTVSASAKHFFGCDSDINGKNISWLVKDKRISDAVEEAAISGGSRMFDYPVSDHLILSLHITQVKNDFIRRHEYAYGAIIMISDVTRDRQAQQMRQEFFSNASHELKTPITSIRGFAELLSSGIYVTAQQQHSYLERMIAEADRMTDLLNDILMISNLESGKRQKNYEPVNLVQVCNEVLSTLTPQIEKKQLSLFSPKEPVLFTCNRQQMYELLINIISNAVKYNKQKGSIHIRCQDLESKISIEVQDSGIGIPLEDQPRIFERFYRVDKGRSRSLGGTGLGLSIVKHIVNQYEGEILLNSRENIGTTIVINLPKQRSMMS